MSKLKLITPITVEIETAESVGEFPIKVKKLTKKEKKPYDKFVKEQEEKYQKTMEKSKKRASLSKEVERMKEDIADISLQIDAEDDKALKLALVTERRELRSAMRTKEDALEKAGIELEKHNEELQTLIEDTEKMFYDLRVVEDDGREALSAAIEEFGLGYGEVLAEINRLVKESNQKKS